MNRLTMMKVSVAFTTVVCVLFAGMGIWLNSEWRQEKALSAAYELDATLATEQSKDYAEQVESLQGVNKEVMADLLASNEERNALEGQLRKEALARLALRGNLEALETERDGLLEETARLERERLMAWGSYQDTADKLREEEERSDNRYNLYRAFEDEAEDLRGQRDLLELSVGELKAMNESLRAELHEAQSDLATAELEIQSRKESEGTTFDLTARIQLLEREIADLEKQREALKVRSSRILISCTGSMEPAITCLDSVTLLTNFRPEDIGVGTVIAFYPPAACRDTLGTGGRTIHRVLKIKQEEGRYHYWTKGDNSPEADNCWVSELSVVGYLTAIHEGTESQNAELRDQVNAAQASLDRSEELLNAAIREHCGRPTLVNCSPGATAAQELKRLHGNYLSNFRFYECFVEAASNATYLPSGPVYRACLRELPAWFGG